MLFQRRETDVGEKLIRGLQHRDQQAVGELYDLLGARVYSVIFAMVHDRNVTEDLVQETFVRVWNCSHQFTGDASTLSHWLLAIGRHKAIDYLRSARRRPELNSLGLEDYSEFLPSPAEFQRTRTDVADARQLRDAISKLPAQQREVIWLAYFEGLSQTEISTRIEHPLGTVKAWTRSALRHLRESVGGERIGLPSAPGSGRGNRSDDQPGARQ